MTHKTTYETSHEKQKYCILGIRIPEMLEIPGVNARGASPCMLAQYPPLSALCALNPRQIFSLFGVESTLFQVSTRVH